MNYKFIRKFKKAGFIFAIIIGVCMIDFYGMLLFSMQSVELKTEPYSFTMHSISEFITALLLIIGGFGGLCRKSWGRIVHIFSLGALFYSSFNAGGYYLQQKNLLITFTFFVILAATAMLILFLIIDRRKYIKENSNDLSLHTFDR